MISGSMAAAFSRAAAPGAGGPGRICAPFPGRGDRQRSCHVHHEGAGFTRRRHEDPTGIADRSNIVDRIDVGDRSSIADRTGAGGSQHHVRTAAPSGPAAYGEAITQIEIRRFFHWLLRCHGQAWRLQALQQQLAAGLGFRTVGVLHRAEAADLVGGVLRGIPPSRACPVVALPSRFAGPPRIGQSAPAPAPARPGRPTEPPPCRVVALPCRSTRKYQRQCDPAGDWHRAAATRGRIEPIDQRWRQVEYRFLAVGCRGVQAGDIVFVLVGHDAMQALGGGAHDRRSGLPNTAVSRAITWSTSVR